jgi:hypothetical protein
MDDWHGSGLGDLSIHYKDIVIVQMLQTYQACVAPKVQPVVLYNTSLIVYTYIVRLSSNIMIMKLSHNITMSSSTHTDALNFVVVVVHLLVHVRKGR